MILVCRSLGNQDVLIHAGMNNLPITEAAVMSWLDLNTPILPHGKFLLVYNSKISGFTGQSATKASVVGKITVTLSKFVPYIDRSFPLSTTEGGIGIFGFAVLAIFQIGFPFLCQSTSVFGFGLHCGLRISRFSAFGFRFSRKRVTGFWDLISDAVFGFSYLTAGSPSSS